MSNEIFVTYKQFTNREELENITQLLDSGHIEFVVEDNTLHLNPYERKPEMNTVYHLKLKQRDFENADSIIESSILPDLDKLPADYYLYNFSDKELIEILTRPDEWNPLDYELSKKILKSRGKTFDDELLETLKTNRLEDLNKPEGSQSSWIAAGYLFALLGGFFGMLIGYVIYSHKKTLPNGNRIYGYNEKDRRHAKRLMFLGFAFWLMYIFMLVKGVDY